jgi:hypothetical protein
VSSSKFEVVDRRGGKKAEAVAVEEIVPATPETTADKSSWEEIKYAIAWRPIPQNQPGPLQIIIIGRALGLRSDGLPFIADYWFSADYEDNRDWEAQAKKRLDTFLGCECNDYGPCGVHKMYFNQWVEADTQRLTLAGNKPVPRVLEILHKVERARMERARNIAVPRG